jgi:predicted nucleic acid-binding protein
VVDATDPPPIVIDASVVVKWVVREIDSDRAYALFAGCTAAGHDPIGPPHLLGEVMNGLYQRYRSADPARHISRDDLDKAIAEVLDYSLEIATPVGLYERAVLFAVNYALPAVYDGLYVVLAQILGAELWTADRRLLTALGGRAPWVRPLSTYPLPPQLR